MADKVGKMIDAAQRRIKRQDEAAIQHAIDAAVERAGWQRIMQEAKCDAVLVPAVESCKNGWPERLSSHWRIVLPDPDTPISQ